MEGVNTYLKIILLSSVSLLKFELNTHLKKKKFPTNITPTNHILNITFAIFELGYAMVVDMIQPTSSTN